MLPILRSLNKVYGPISVIHFDAHLVSNAFLTMGGLRKLNTAYRTLGQRTLARAPINPESLMEPFSTLLKRKVYLEIIASMVASDAN